MFILDSSNTIGENTFGRMKQYTQQLVDEINVENCDVRVGLMKYSSAAMIQFNIGTFRYCIGYIIRDHF